MEYKFLVLIFTIFSIGQASSHPTTITSPDEEQENKNLAWVHNYFAEFLMKFADPKDTNNFDVEQNSLSPSFPRIDTAVSSEEGRKSLPGHIKYENLSDIHAENNEYSPRSIQNNRRRGNNRRRNRRNRRSCRGRGQNGYGNRGGHNGNGGGGQQYHRAHPAETSAISAQAAVIGAGSVISGVAVTT